MAATAPPPEVRYRRPGRLACGVRAFRLFHYTGLVPVHGGWVGVDVFFVISGHLTTGILVREHCRRGAIDLRRFYVRRARPLFPALAGLLLGVGLYLLVADTDLDPLMELLPALLYLMNWVGAFDIHDAVLTGHTRSLAIEEQYYFSWLLLFVALAAGPHSMRCVVIGLAVLLALVLVWHRQSVVLQQTDAGSARAVYGFDTHADGLLIGGLVAMLSPRMLGALARARLLALVCLVGIVFFQMGNVVALSVGGYSLPAVASGLLVVAVVSDQRGLLMRTLEARPLVLLVMVLWILFMTLPCRSNHAVRRHRCHRKFLWQFDAPPCLAAGGDVRAVSFADTGLLVSASKAVVEAQAAAFRRLEEA